MFLNKFIAHQHTQQINSKLKLQKSLQFRITTQFLIYFRPLGELGTKQNEQTRGRLVFETVYQLYLSTSGICLALFISFFRSEHLHCGESWISEIQIHTRYRKPSA